MLCDTSRSRSLRNEIPGRIQFHHTFGSLLLVCGNIYGSEAGLKRHMARCPCEPRSRAGTRSEKAMHRRQRVAAAEAEAPIKMKGDGSEPEDIGFVFDFKYLGFWFQNDGDS